MSTKVACTKCGAMLLPRTADRNAGLCMPCAHGSRDTIEKSHAFSQKRKEYDPVRELWHSILHKVHHSEGGYSSLTEAERIYFCACLLEGEVYNGGMHQFFSNSSGDYYDDVVIALTRLKAENSLALLKSAAVILFDNISPPADQKQRWGVMKPFAPKGERAEWEAPLDKIDRAFWDDPDNLARILDDFTKREGLLIPFLIDTPGQGNYA